MYDGLRMVREKECYELQGLAQENCLRQANAGYEEYRPGSELHHR